MWLRKRSSAGLKSFKNVGKFLSSFTTGDLS
jgi:hypothetical protein